MRSIEHLIQLFPEKTGKELLEIQKQDKLRDEKEIEEMKNAAATAAVIGTFFGSNNQKLGNEGSVLHYDIITNMSIVFCSEFPHDFDWEEFGMDWEEAIMQFINRYIHDNDILLSDNFWNQ